MLTGLEKCAAATSAALRASAALRDRDGIDPEETEAIGEKGLPETRVTETGSIERKYGEKSRKRQTQ
jgi:hypothetical protein